MFQTKAEAKRASTADSRTGTWLVAAMAAASMFAAGAGLMSLALAHPNLYVDTNAHVAKLVDPADPEQIDTLLDAIEPSRVIMIGETHDRYDHHLNQLAVIRGLHERGVPLAIGMEYFQRPFQPHLDDFIAGRIGEAELLARSEWDRRWRFDVRLYRDILAYAQRERLPLVALNAASETVSTVSDGGIDALAPRERQLFPPRIELATGAYRQQLERVFALHGSLPEARLQRFLQVQYVWDQTMARTAGEYLTSHPERTLIVLAGSGHLLHDDAIPKRLRRINPARQTVLVTDTGWMPAGARPDHVFAARALTPTDRTQVAGAALN
jgi:uncharacterized iron-regulated protein